MDMYINSQRDLEMCASKGPSAVDSQRTPCVRNRAAGTNTPAKLAADDVAAHYMQQTTCTRATRDDVQQRA